MAMTMHLNIVSAEEEIFSGTVESVFVPLLSGEVGIYPRHTPLIGEIKPGEIIVRSDEGENEQHFFVSGGILEVQPHVVTVLSDTAIRAKDLDESVALEAKRHAEEAMAGQKTDMEFALAQAELAEAAAQLNMIRKLREKK
ncbi:MAG: F0F1 ATP synthase subunit epsilon [Gammaproteobacteria bacterium]|nr:F0F1 ATP synthase subunit epsilon [Gammaproteobacteria bacterium]MDX2486987.1 F0F1 ATP synthase subunit epsilon [Gammaproteobacteria bacterium]